LQRRADRQDHHAGQLGRRCTADVPDQQRRRDVYDIFEPDGTELQFTVVAGTGVIGMRLNTGFIKFRSGTRERPVVQPELREFAVAIDVVGGAPAAGNELRVRLLGGFAP